MQCPGIVPAFSSADNGHDVLVRLQRTVQQLALEDPEIRHFYIGIGSGTDYHAALKRRYDGKKKDWRITHMIALYRNRSQQVCREVEAELETYFQTVNHDMVAMDEDMPGIMNGRGGGAGRPSSQPWHFVYLAVRHAGRR